MECITQPMMTETMVCNCNSSGVLVDGLVPVLDTTQAGMWASDLYAIQGTSRSLTLVFRLATPIMLQQVDVYLFYCPDWNIPTKGVNVNISIFNAFHFPLERSSGEHIGATVLNNDIEQECTSTSLTLSRISIHTHPTSHTDVYLITFETLSGTLGGIYIGEVRFSNETISRSASTSKNYDKPIDKSSLS